MEICRDEHTKLPNRPSVGQVTSTTTSRPTTTSTVTVDYEHPCDSFGCDQLCFLDENENPACACTQNYRKLAKLSGDDILHILTYNCIFLILNSTR